MVILCLRELYNDIILCRNSNGFLTYGLEIMLFERLNKKIGTTPSINIRVVKPWYLCLVEFR